jgi:hypothetical protein
MLYRLAQGKINTGRVLIQSYFSNRINFPIDQDRKLFMATGRISHKLVKLHADHASSFIGKST